MLNQNLNLNLNAGLTSGMIEQYVSDAARRHYARRNERHAAIQNAHQLQARQDEIRAVTAELLGSYPGPMPDGTGLKSQPIHTIVRDGYRVDVVSWQTIPGVFTTANLYLPRNRPGPFPAVVCLCHASPEGKANADYQRLGQLLSRRGIAALVFDNVGQGERLEFYDATLRRSWLGKLPADERAHVGNLLFLTGDHLAGWMFQEARHAIDWLAARGDIERTMIGVAGDGSGAAMGRLLCALEPRIAAGVLVGDSLRGEALGGEDIERCLFNSLPRGVMPVDLLVPFAPKPLLLATYAVERGAVDALLETAAELNRWYALMGAKEQVGVVGSDGQKGFPKDLRARAMEHFARAFSLPEERVREPETPPEKEQDLACTETGQVSNSLKAEMVFSIQRKLAERLPPALTVPQDEAGVAELQSQIRDRFLPFLHLPEAAAPVKGEIESRSSDWGLQVEKGRIVIDKGLYAPYSFYAPPESAGMRRVAPTVLALHERGIAGVSMMGTWMQAFAVAGVHVAAIDVAGIGETRLQNDRDDVDAYDKLLCGAESIWARRALNAGLSLFGLRVFSVLRTLAYLRTRHDVDKENISVVGVGRGGLWALYAAAMDRDVSRLAMVRSLSTYRSLTERRRHNHHFSLYLPGCLKSFDLPHVAACVAPRPFAIINPVDQRKERRDLDAVKRDYALTSAVYKVLRTPESFRAATADTAPETLGLIKEVVGAM